MPASSLSGTTKSRDIITKNDTIKCGNVLILTYKITLPRLGIESIDAFLAELSDRYEAYIRDTLGAERITLYNADTDRRKHLHFPVKNVYFEGSAVFHGEHAVVSFDTVETRESYVETFTRRTLVFCVKSGNLVFDFEFLDKRKDFGNGLGKKLPKDAFFSLIDGKIVPCVNTFPQGNPIKLRKRELERYIKVMDL